MMKSYRLALSFRSCASFVLTAIVLLAVLAAAPAFAMDLDTVEIIGGRFPAGQAGLWADVRLVNSEILSEITIPLEFRSIEPGAFINSCTEMIYQERFLDPNILPDVRYVGQYESADGDSCLYATASFMDGGFHSVTSSPEGFVFICAGDAGSEFLQPGADPVGSGSMRIGFSLTSTPGRFVIDTMCVDPGGVGDHLRFLSPDAGEVTVVFKQGIVRLNGPPIARDTTITVTVNDIVTGFLPASDPNIEDTLLYSVVVPPASGSLDVDSAGNFIYSADAGDGVVTFDYMVNDGLLIDEGTVTIIIEPLPPDTVYVRKNGDDLTGDGTSANPFRTIPHAMSVADSRDFIFVGPGIYDQPAEVPIVFPSARTLTVQSEEGPFVTELVGTSDASGSVVVMDLGNDIDSATIVGFTIRGNVVTDPGCTYCAGGISVMYLTNAHIVNCIVRNNTGHEAAGGIRFNGSSGSIINNWITGNVGPSGSAVGGVDVLASASIPIVNNTIVGNAGPDAEGVAGIRLEESAVLAHAVGVHRDFAVIGTRLDNNLIAFNSPGYGALAILTVPTSTVNNLYFGNGGSPQGFSSLLTWVFDDPLLKDEGAGELHLTCGSPARNNGLIESVPDELSTDIDGQPRLPSDLPPRVDIGADQFFDEDKEATFTQSADSGCAPLLVDFSNVSTCIDEQWSWDFGDGGTATTKNATHEFLEGGVYEIRLIASGTYDADTTFDTVYVDSEIGLTFTSDAQSGCVPFEVDFTAFADPSADLFVWDFGDGDVDTGQQVTHTYTSPATRTVTLYAANSCSTFTHVNPNYITAKIPPVVQLSSSFDTVVGAPCNPFAVQFSYTSDQPILAWEWDFGDNHTSTDSLPLHVYAEGDTFSVRLRATGECGTVQDVNLNYIRLTPRPKATGAIAAPTFACVGLTQVAFSANVVGSYNNAFWVLGDGGTAPGVIANHTYSQVGRYLPKLVIVSSCGQDTVALADSITVGSLPVASFSLSADSGYDPFSVQFTDESSNLPDSWLWRFGDNATSTVRHPSHAYAPGVYRASLIAGNSCGTDTSVDRRIVVGSFRAPVIDSLGTLADTVLYSLLVDSLVIGYDHPVYLTGRITPLPIQGSMTFIFDPPSGIPPFTAVMKVIPSLNLATGNYSLEILAVDSTRLNGQGQPVTKTATHPFPYVGFTAVQATPSPVVMESTVVAQGLTSRVVTIRNTSTPLQPYTLVIQAAQISGPPFEIVQGQGTTLNAGQSLAWTIGFRPTKKGDFTGVLHVRSNDPGNPDLEVPLIGRGIGEQRPPKIETASPGLNAEATIDQNITLVFDERMLVVSLDTVLRVQSKRMGAAVNGARQMTAFGATFTPTNWFWPDDTVTVTLLAIITDTNGNRLDGNGDDEESGSPADDFRLTFYTGPGVYPGDANHDGSVNEADILPLGRFWRLQGPPRSHPYTSFSVQPARGFPIRIAAHADCDGNGIIDSADICPIAEFFDQDTVLPKAIVQAWLTEARSWSSTTVDALLGALLDCSSQGQGNAILRQTLTEMKVQNPVPVDYTLDQNYPNPFNPATVISFSLSHAGDVALDVFDILGRRVTTLAEGHWEAGNHRVVWDGRDDEGREAASGIYFYRLHADSFVKTRKMLLLK